MHQTVDIVFDLDERAEIGQTADGTFEPGAGRILGVECFPGVVLGLLHSERDLLVFAVDLEHHHLDDITDIYQLGGMAYVLGPGHLGDMYQALDAFLQFDEGTVVGDRDDFATNLGVGRIFILDIFPRVRGQLLES